MSGVLTSENIILYLNSRVIVTEQWSRLIQAPEHDNGKHCHKHRDNEANGTLLHQALRDVTARRSDARDGEQFDIVVIFVAVIIRRVELNRELKALVALSL